MTTQYIDVFNGDADGLCALVQLRRNNPQTSQLVTGIKRDINLLKNVHAQAGTHITVLDISFEKNSADVARLLNQGASIEYIDHHRSGEIPRHPQLATHINLASDTCTALIVNKLLHGKYSAWAITAAFGDNQTKPAQALGRKIDLAEQQLKLLQQLGTYLNYNGYGASLDDLFFDPVVLFEKLNHFDSPFDFIQQQADIFNALEEGCNQDMQQASHAPFEYCDSLVAITILPHKKWARRVSGVYSNALSNQSPDRAHAVLTEKENGNYLVSIRAPLNRKHGADELATRFPTGGGRKAAAGINDLAQQDLTLFMQQMQLQFSPR